MVGTGELLVILVVILILFGGKKLPEFARNLGQGIREFKKACNGEEKSDEVVTSIEEKKGSCNSCSCSSSSCSKENK